MTVYMLYIFYVAKSIHLDICYLVTNVYDWHIRTLSSIGGNVRDAKNRGKTSGGKCPTSVAGPGVANPLLPHPLDGPEHRTNFVFVRTCPCYFSHRVQAYEWPHN